MLRSSVGWCFAVLLVVGGVNACSGKSGDEATGTAGTTTTGGSNDAGSGGTNATSGSSTGGTRTMGGTENAGGVACADVPLTCVDTIKATGCNTDTNMVETFSCVDDLAMIGVISKGCTKDALMGDHCDVSGFKDEGCRAGAVAYAFCQGSTSQERLNVYINCYTDYMGIHDKVTCLGTELTEQTAAACQRAADVCINGAGGAGAGGAAAGGAGGAGGAG